MVNGFPGSNGQSAARFVEEELETGLETVKERFVKEKKWNRNIVTQKNVASGVPGASGQNAARFVGEELEVGLETVRKGRFVKEKMRNRKFVTLRIVKVFVAEITYVFYVYS